MAGTQLPHLIAIPAAWTKALVGSDLVSDVGVELRERHDHLLGAEACQLFLDVRRAQGIHGLTVNRGDDLARRPCRHVQPDPEIVIGIRVTDLGHRRHVEQD